ncbi:MAG: triose-phosphate isomerase [Anaerolineae bacterium]|nr:triose-phosphate isomerase [Anaerolineae bacterium]
MRTPIIAGNWKAFKTIPEALALVGELADSVRGVSGVEMAVCPPFTALAAVAERLRGTSIKVGAQNVYWEKQGAYTGEITPPMLQGLVDYVIIGHSERRKLFGETDETVNKKVHAVLAHNLLPIIAVGENLDENEAGKTGAVVTRQIRGGFQGLSADQARTCVVAYEPVWAIGTGETATPAVAQQACAYIRGVLREISPVYADAIRIQYGGSVNAENAAELLSQPDIDGALVGGASLKADQFAAICAAAG